MRKIFEVWITCFPAKWTWKTSNKHLDLIYFKIRCWNSIGYIDCGTITITLNNDVLAKTGSAFQGTYVLSDTIAAEKTWVSVSNSKAIWYSPQSTKWLIGKLADIGTGLGNINTGNKYRALFDINNIWQYWNGSNWVPTSPNDFSITCSGNW